MIVATAGHVDHGKTTLVKQLTGVDTDRLEEERRRGLSISLGFAYLRHATEQGKVMGFIDVPGHQRFINTMISGVSGIDLGLLVIAADDGVMPQTREHLEIMRLLGVTDFVVAITKCDRADSNRIAEVSADARYLCAGESGRDIPVFPVSTLNREGLAALLAYLSTRLADHVPRTPRGNFRLAIDRVFTLKGLGLVATGTVISGRIRENDSLYCIPGMDKLRIRSLHAQDLPVAAAAAGVRCAVNLAGEANRDTVQKGAWLVGPEALPPTCRFTAAMTFVESPVRLRHMMTVKLYIGARYLQASISLSLRESRLPGMADAQALVQLLTREPVSCCRGDRFLVRDNSENFLLGGGNVIDPWAARLRGLDEAMRYYLSVMLSGDFAAALATLVVEKAAVVEYTPFRQAWNLTELEAREELEIAGLWSDLAFADTDAGQLVVSRGRYQALQKGIVDAVRHFHHQHPHARGMAPAQLTTALDLQSAPGLVPALLNSLCLVDAGDDRLVQAGGHVRLANHQPGLSEKARGQWQAFELYLASQGLEIPLLSDVENRTGIRGREMNHLVSYGVKSGYLHRISPKRVGLGATLRELAGHVLELAATKPVFTVIDFRDKLGCGRNYVIELLDYMDSIGFTEREGNTRTIRDGAVPANLFH